MKTPMHDLMDHIAEIGITNFPIVTLEKIIQLRATEREYLEAAFQDGWSTPHGEKCPQSGKEYFEHTFTNINVQDLKYFGDSDALGSNGILSKL